MGKKIILPICPNTLKTTPAEPHNRFSQIATPLFGLSRNRISTDHEFGIPSTVPRHPSCRLVEASTEKVASRRDSPPFLHWAEASRSTTTRFGELGLAFTKRKMLAVPNQGDNALAFPRPRPGSELAIHAPFPPGKNRTSSLESPIMLLTGHQSAIYTMKFNPSGTVVASGSHDKDIFLWFVHGDCKNFMVLHGHKNAVLDLQWTSDGSQIISASPDKTLRAWDVETGKQVKKMAEHSSFVNSCCPSRRGPPLVVSGSDDGTAKLWDLRQRGAVQTFPDKYQITAVGFSDASDKIFSGGLDNDVKVWDLRRNEVTMTLQGHGDMITGMQLSPDGSYLLTNGMDCTLRIWDMRPYAPQNRCVKIFSGHQHNFEKNLIKCAWSPDGSRVTAGSSDRMVYIWDTTSRRILYKLPGHNGSVNETAFHPTEPIIGSCSSDKQIYLGEI